MIYRVILLSMLFLISVRTCIYVWRNRKILATAYNLPSILPMSQFLWCFYFLFYGLPGGIKRIMDKTAYGYYTKSWNVAILWAGPSPIFCINAPEDMHRVLNSPNAMEKGKELNVLHRFMGNGLLLAPEHIWKKTRRPLNPVFHPRNLHLSMSNFNMAGRDLCQLLSRHVDQGHVDIFRDVGRVAIKNILAVIFGSSLTVNVNSEVLSQLTSSIERLNHLVYEHTTRVWLWSDFIFDLCYREMVSTFNRNIEEFLNEYKEVEEMIMINTEEDETFEESKEGSLHHIKDIQITVPQVYRELGKTNPDFGKKELYEEIMSFMLAGSETTKTATSCCLFALAAHQDVQERLYEEIESVTGSLDSDVTSEDIRAMPYLDQVLKETLRRFTTTTVVSRSLKGDITISNCTIPAGATVHIQSFVLNFNPTIFAEPYKFDPEHFNPNNLAKKGSFSFIPFGSGPHSCIGRSYSMLVMKILVVHVIRRYKITTCYTIDDIKYTPGMVFHSSDGYRIQFKERH